MDVVFLFLVDLMAMENKMSRMRELALMCLFSISIFVLVEHQIQEGFHTPNRLVLLDAASPWLIPSASSDQQSDETSLGCWIWQHSGFRLDNPCIVNLAIKFRNILQVTWLGCTWIDRKPVRFWIKNYCSIKLLKVYWGYKKTPKKFHGFQEVIMKLE